MKKSIVVSICCVLFAMTLIPMSVSAKEVELKLASWGPGKHYVAEARAVWIEEVNKALAGKYKIVDFPGGQLYGPKDVHKAIAKGQIDLGVVLQPRMLAMVPMVQGVYLPFAFDDINDAAKAYSGESLAIIEKAMEKKHLKLIYVSYLDPVQIFSNKLNINTVEDFDGMKILSTSPIFSEIIVKLGAAPDTSIPQTEQYMALKRNVADSVAQSIVGAYFQKTIEVAPLVSKMNLSYPTILVCMNLKKWKSLDKEAQDVLTSIGKKQGDYTLAVSQGWEKKFTGALAEAGATITTLSPEERAKIKATAKPIWEQWAKENGKDGQRLLELNLQQ